MADSWLKDDAEELCERVYGPSVFALTGGDTKRKAEWLRAEIERVARAFAERALRDVIDYHCSGLSMDGTEAIGPTTRKQAQLIRAVYPNNRKHHTEDPMPKLIAEAIAAAESDE